MGNWFWYTKKRRYNNYYVLIFEISRNRWSEGSLKWRVNTIVLRKQNINRPESILGGLFYYSSYFINFFVILSFNSSAVLLHIFDSSFIASSKIVSPKSANFCFNFFRNSSELLRLKQPSVILYWALDCACILYHKKNAK